MRLPWTKSVESDKLFLKKCNEGDRQAQERFAYSYFNEVKKAVRAELEDDYDSATVERIVKICVRHIYSLWKDLPSPASDLGVRIRKAAQSFAADWRKQDLQ